MLATVYKATPCVKDITELLGAMSMILSLKCNGHVTFWLQVAVDSVIGNMFTHVFVVQDTENVQRERETERERERWGNENRRRNEALLEFIC